ncbi:MAG: hypothetical protein JWQ98_274 [Chlorobi bacterium]|nr:hypothetical protein [Chlorobiota bacterium]
MRSSIRFFSTVAAAVLASSVAAGAAGMGARLAYVAHNDVSQQPDPKKKDITATTRVENDAVTLTAYFPDDAPSLKVGLYNILGKLIELHPVNVASKGEERAFRFLMKGLPSGPYIVVLESNGQRIVNKVMVSR